MPTSSRCVNNEIFLHRTKCVEKEKSMKNMKKIFWFNLTLQMLYLLTGMYYQVFVFPMFKQTFEQFSIELPMLTRILIEKYLLIIVIFCTFALFLWAWRHDYLENRPIMLIIKLVPLVMLCTLIISIYT